MPSPRVELCERRRLRYVKALMQLTPQARAREVRQLVLDWMDVVEQTDEEALPIKLLQIFDAEPEPPP